MSRRRLLAGAAAAVVALATWLFVIAPEPDTPERRVAAYLDATGAGKPAGRAGRVGRASDLSTVRGSELDSLRSDLTRELTALRAGRTYSVTSIEWWRTCCEPGPIDGPRNAGLAPMHVLAADASGSQHRLVFEVWVKKLTWWGDAAGETVKNWTVYEVHHEGGPSWLASPPFGC